MCAVKAGWKAISKKARNFMRELKLIAVRAMKDGKIRLVHVEITSFNQADINTVMYRAYVDDEQVLALNYHTREGHDFVSLTPNRIEKCVPEVVGAVLLSVMHLNNLEVVWITDEFFSQLIDRYAVENKTNELSLFHAFLNGEPALHVHYRENEVEVCFNKKRFSTQQQSILDAALNENIEIKHLCKSGVCGKCRLDVLSGTALATSTIIEPALIGPTQILACSFKAITSMEVE
ncbi:hypothetical protein AWH66_2007400 [Vibrio barjaei]|nr:hypothetical protein AWH66_2007400 [Vibrio barjaei]